MEPCNCVVSVKNDYCEIWAGTQNPKNAVDRASKIIGIDKKYIKINVTFLGGGFGRKSFNDFIDEGIYISKKLKNQRNLFGIEKMIPNMASIDLPVSIY